MNKNVEQVDVEQNNDNGIERGFSNRQIQLITLSGAIGTGLSMEAKKTTHFAGYSILFVYSIIVIMLFFVVNFCSITRY